MSMSRRELFAAGTVLGVSALGLAACSTASDSTAGTTPTTPPQTSKLISVEQNISEITIALHQRGYTPVTASSLTTGNSFNGGLMYDVDDSTISGQSYVVQTAARVEDVAKRNVPGTLPIFSMLCMDTTTPALAHQVTDTVMHLLTSVAGLKATQLRVTTTDHSAEFFPQLAGLGITRAQIRLRPWATAVAEGSGSGFFAPKGYPGAPAFPSFSIEHVQSDGTELEVAEIVYGTGAVKVASAIGPDRVAMARNDQATLWDHSIAAFTNAVEGAVQKTGVALPPGYYAILGKEQPAATGA